MLNDGRSVSRLGIITSKKIGNAVIRNEMRRILRDIFRKKLQKCGGSYDYLVIVKKRSPYEKIEIELLNAAAILHEQTSLRRREL
jgi:ribonuclease P protein component